MDSMGNDHRNLRNKLSDFIADDENEELRCLGIMRTDANFNGLNEDQYTAAAGFHDSQFSDRPVSFSHPNFAGSFSNSISYTDVDWSFNASRFGRSSPNWSQSIFTNSKNKTNASFHVRNPELASICRETDNHNLQSSGREEQIDLNISAISSGFQPAGRLVSWVSYSDHSIDDNAETLDVGCQTKDDSGAVPNLTTFAENSVGDIINSLRNVAPSTAESMNSQIGLSSQSWLTDLKSGWLRMDQSQRRSLGISATISAPDQSFELDHSVGHSQPPQNVVNALTSGHEDAREFGTVEDFDLTNSYHNQPLFNSSTFSDPSEILFQAHIAQFLSKSVSPDITSHLPIQPQKIKTDPSLQKQPIISESVPLVSSKFEDLRDRSLGRSRTSGCYIKCRGAIKNKTIAPIGEVIALRSGSAITSPIDLDQTPKLSGERCYLCKRDLSFKPEGSLVLPKIPPTVAVLPCGHVFHDLCLERITPPNQAEEYPPCIPCAVRET